MLQEHEIPSLQIVKECLIEDAVQVVLVFFIEGREKDHNLSFNHDHDTHFSNPCLRRVIWRDHQGREWNTYLILIPCVYKCFVPFIESVQHSCETDNTPKTWQDTFEL